MVTFPLKHLECRQTDPGNLHAVITWSPVEKRDWSCVEEFRRQAEISWSLLKREGPTCVSAAPSHILGMLCIAIPWRPAVLCYQSSAVWPGKSTPHC